MADPLQGDANLHVPAALIGDQTRARVLLALLDGRALPMSMLAVEAGVSASTASEHLAKLVDGGLLSVRRQGRHRYYVLASAEVAAALEALARLAPQAPITSLRASTRQHALRSARTCYDHLAGHAGVSVMSGLIDRGALTGGDGVHHPDRAPRDRLSAPGHDLTYEVTDSGWQLFERIDLEVPKTRRRLVRYCVDWTEQRHHLAGALGAALLERMLELAWLTRLPVARAVRVTPDGSAGLRDWLGIEV